MNPPQVGPYQVLGELHRDSAGQVLRARDPSLGRDVAVKLLHRSAGWPPEVMQRFRAEVAAAARLRHPRLAGVHTLGFEHGQPYVVMDFVDGESLWSRIQRDGPLTPAEASRLAVDVAEALDYAHSRGVLHLDLRPHNVLLANDGSASISEWGLGTTALEVRATSSSAIVGSPVYLAPEQANADHDRIGPATDVYGLGSVLYSALTGRPPFQGKTTIEAMANVLEKEVVPPSELGLSVPHALEAICLRCLAKDPGQRFFSAAEVGQALAAGTSGGPGSTRRWAAELAAASRPTGTSRWWPLSLSIVVGAIGFALGVVVGAPVGPARPSPSPAATPLELTRLRQELAQARQVGQAAESELAEARRRSRELEQRIFDLQRARSSRPASSRSPDEGARVDPAKARELFEQGTRAMQAGRLDEAVQLLMGAIRHYPTWVQAYAQLGIALRRQRRYDEARQVLDKAISLGPSYANAYNTRGNVFLDQDELRLALADFRRAIELDPSLAVAHNNLGLVLLRADRLPEAIKALDTALSLEPRYGDAFFNRAAAHYNSGAYEAALADYTEAAAHGKGGSRQCFLNRARCYERLLRYDEALADLDRVLQAQDSQDALLIRGRVRLSAGDEAGGQADLRRAVELGPSSDDGRQAQALLDERQG